MKQWLMSMFIKSKKSSPRRSVSQPRRGIRLEIEALETRLVPTANVSFTNGAFTLTDTAATDVTVSNFAEFGHQIVLTGDTFANPSTPIGGITGFGTNTLNIFVPVSAGFTITTGGGITVNPGTGIVGPISLTGQGDATDPVGVNINGATLNANGGNILLNGTGLNSTTTSGNNGYGVEIQGSALVETGDLNGIGGTITITGTGSVSGTNGNTGVYITGTSTNVSTMDGNLAINGYGNGTGSNNYGIGLQNGATVQSTGMGNINLNGWGSVSGTNSNTGVYITDAGTNVSTLDGNLTITGHGYGAGSNNYGIGLQNGATVQSTAGMGTIILNGTGSNGSGSMNDGVYLYAGNVKSALFSNVSLTGDAGSGSGGQDCGVVITNASMIQVDTNSIPADPVHGDLLIVGNGGGLENFNYGVEIDGGAWVKNNNSDGGINIQGTGGNGLTHNQGVYIGGLSTLLQASGVVNLSGIDLSSGSSEYGILIQNQAYVTCDEIYFGYAPTSGGPDSEYDVFNNGGDLSSQAHFYGLIRPHGL